MSRAFDGQRFRAMLLKESLQILRDPSTFLIAFVLPLIMLFPVRLCRVTRSDTHPDRTRPAGFGRARVESRVRVRAVTLVRRDRTP